MQSPGAVGDELGDCVGYAVVGDDVGSDGAFVGTEGDPVGAFSQHARNPSRGSGQHGPAVSPSATQSGCSAHETPSVGDADGDTLGEIDGLMLGA